MNKICIFLFCVSLRCRFVPGECCWPRWPFSFTHAHSKLCQLLCTCKCGWQGGEVASPRVWWSAGTGMPVLCTHTSFRGPVIAESPRHPLIGSTRSLQSWQMLSPWASDSTRKPSSLRVIIMVGRGICVLCTLLACTVFSSCYANIALNLEMPICINILVSYS